jgi:hypothetical protein
MNWKFFWRIIMSRISNGRIISAVLAGFLGISAGVMAQITYPSNCPWQCNSSEDCSASSGDLLAQQCLNAAAGTACGPECEGTAHKTLCKIGLNGDTCTQGSTNVTCGNQKKGTCNGAGTAGDCTNLQADLDANNNPVPCQFKVCTNPQ